MHRYVPAITWVGTAATLGALHYVVKNWVNSLEGVALWIVATPFLILAAWRIWTIVLWAVDRWKRRKSNAGSHDPVRDL